MVLHNSNEYISYILRSMDNFTACMCFSIDSRVSLVPRLLCGGGEKRAWYTRFAHAPSSLTKLHRPTEARSEVPATRCRDFSSAISAPALSYTQKAGSVELWQPRQIEDTAAAKW